MPNLSYVHNSEGVCCADCKSICEALCVRLLPGDDLLQSLREFACRREIRAGAILSCVGSLGAVCLRPAGVREPRVFSDHKFEIVSLVGTISMAGLHLHASVSDEECRVFGGHLLEGSLVRTTAEVVVGVMEGPAFFTRVFDKRTGFSELSMR